MSQDKIELLPCPFCGGIPSIIGYKCDPCARKILCQSPYCGINPHTNMGMNMDSVKKTWNTRTSAHQLEAAQKRIAELECALRRARKWGVKTDGGWSGDVAVGVSQWIDQGMRGPLPEITSPLVLGSDYADSLFLAPTDGEGV
jgi:hypothetical protein